MNITGLLRVTIATPQRRLDLALPEQSSVAEVLPGVLTKAGEHLADEGAPGGGWVLRRDDGTELLLGRTLGSHRIRDGEILHLVPRRLEWPELEYDDLVDAVASGSGRLGAAWSPWHTRLAGLACAAVALLVVITSILRLGAPWQGPAGWLLITALLLVAGAVTLARVVGDSGAGVMIGGTALPCAVLGGGLLLAGTASWPAVGAPQILAASAALILAGAACHLGVVDGAVLFVGATSVGVLGIIGGWIGISDSLGGSEVAAILAPALLGFSPLLASLALRLGRLPMPILPRTTADLVRDDPLPPRNHVYGLVVRADGLLTGMLVGLMLVLSACQVLLVLAETRSATILVCLLSAGAFLRTRLYPIVKQRLLLLIPGVVGTAGLILGPVSRRLTEPVQVIVPVVLLLAALAVFFGLRYSDRRPSPYLSRYAEILELMVALALIPVAAAVLGLYGAVRGWGG
ncbi:type VII secretion integral membrane protein EccD [Kribbella sp. CA-293567]|uniref:type VII secretion integral membrane protein EccD n=1 Tax=Kribbella sp. CA-293567 TaxID=3002436 RepID=UPI0022DDF361|nr:type VII secretion integral membrane protein EccD [Kribbella sp. CA-293567]WBQ08430.1 type VII secretion integral membrane protein EccD [Kribbella sp. CA-293567]